MSDYFDLGNHSRPASDVPAAQTWFDRGLVWLYAYNHEEAIACFEKALEADADCALAHWGIAYGIGPNYNKPWEVFTPEEKAPSLDTAHSAIAAGLALKHAKPVEDIGLAAETKDISDRGMVDALIVTGERTGEGTKPEDLQTVKANTALPVLIYNPPPLQLAVLLITGVLVRVAAPVRMYSPAPEPALLPNTCVLLNTALP